MPTHAWVRYARDLTSASAPPASANFTVPTVTWSLDGRAKLVRFRRSLWRRLAALWIGGPALFAAGLALAGSAAVPAAVLAIAGVVITSCAPGVTVVYAIRNAIVSRQLRELPELATATLRPRLLPSGPK